MLPCGAVVERARINDVNLDAVDDEENLLPEAEDQATQRKRNRSEEDHSATLDKMKGKKSEQVSYENADEVCRFPFTVHAYRSLDSRRSCASYRTPSVVKSKSIQRCITSAHYLPARKMGLKKKNPRRSSLAVIKSSRTTDSITRGCCPIISTIVNYVLFLIYSFLLTAHDGSRCQGRHG